MYSHVLYDCMHEATLLRLLHHFAGKHIDLMYSKNLKLRKGMGYSTLRTDYLIKTPSPLASLDLQTSYDNV